MKKENVVEFDSQIEEEIIEEPKKKFFTKDRLKKIGIIAIGAVVAGIAILVGMSASSNSELIEGTDDNSDDLLEENNDDDSSESEEKEETLEETEA